MCLKFAAELEKRTTGELGGQVYPNSSLMKTVPQYDAVRRGALDLSLYPISYAGGELPELNIGLMPGLVSSYKQGAAWKNSEVGQKFSALLASKNVLILSWIWQAGGLASRAAPIVNPEEAKGKKIRGGSREMDMMFQAAGATTLSTPSNELYAAMQTGACDGLHHLLDQPDLIPARRSGQEPRHRPGQVVLVRWQLEPLIMSKLIFDKLPKQQQDVIMALGAELEKFGTDEAIADDEKVAEVYQKEGREGRRSR